MGTVKLYLKWTTTQVPRWGTLSVVYHLSLFMYLIFLVYYTVQEKKHKMVDPPYQPRA